MGRSNPCKKILQIGLFLTPITSPLFAQVQLDKVISLTDKKVVPQILRLDNDKNAWILDGTNNSLEKISSSGTVEAVIGPKNNLFKKPVDFLFTKEGKILLLDRQDWKAILLKDVTDPEDKEKPWSKVEAESQFPVPNPSSLALSQDDIIAVGSAEDKTVKVFSIDGTPLFNLYPPEDKSLKDCSRIAYSNDGVLWVLDGKRGLLHRFSPKRKWIGATEGVDGGKGLAVDEFGTAYVILKEGRWKEINNQGSIKSTFGTKGKDPGKMKAPADVALLDAETLLVADNGNRRFQFFKLANEEKIAPLLKSPACRIQIRRYSEFKKTYQMALFNKKGDILFYEPKKSLFEWATQKGISISTFTNVKSGKNSTGFRDPAALALDLEGQVWVVDAGDNQLKKISDSGEVQEIFGKKGGKEGSLKNPESLNFLPDGSFLVIDKNRTRIQVLSPKELFLYSVGVKGNKEGQLKSVTGVAVNNDKIAVLDSDRKALIFFDHKGKFLKEIANKEGKPPVWKNPIDIAATYEGNFLIMDVGLGRIRIFDPTGNFVDDFNIEGKRLISGPDNKVLVLRDKDTELFSVFPVSESPQNLQAEVADGDVKLSWDPDPMASEYKVYRSTDGKNFNFLAKSFIEKTADPTTIPGKMYTYGARSVNGLGYEGFWAVSQQVKGPKKENVSLISIGNVSFDPLFTAAYKFYSDHPIGTIQLKNYNEIPYKDVKISLALKKYTDFATEKVIPAVDPGETSEIPVTLTLNDKVLEISETTPAQMDVSVSFFEDNKEKKVSQNVPLTLYSRNAIAWNDKARIASFITTQDPPVVEFSRTAVKAFLPLLKNATVGKPLAKMVLFYEALNALDISYVEDPTSPFSKASLDPEYIDYVQFPRETLRRKTGDCDDTTALLSALLESIGVETALVDTPGHIFMMANLDESDPEIIGFPPEKLVEFRGTYWVPIETTKLGNPFPDAWQSGISEINNAREKGKFDFIPFSIAREKFAPVTLVEEDKNQPAFPQERLEKTFPPILADLEKERSQNQLSRLNALIKESPDNHLLQIQLGMALLEGGEKDKAKELFKSLLTDPSVDVQAAAQNNLGNMAYLEGDFAGAQKAYEEAGILDPNDGGILINRARVAVKMKNEEEAKNLLIKAKEMMPDWKEYVYDIPTELWPK